MKIETIQALVAASTPFLRIDDARSVAWRRNVAKGSRVGPWKFEAVFTELDGRTWRRDGEVLYFVTDRHDRLRLVGESGRRLRDRWRTSPMHDVSTGAPLGRHALFHSTAWGAIEAGLADERAPFTVRALFREDGDLERVLADHCAMGLLPRSNKHLCHRTEQAILTAVRKPLALWNRQ